MPEAGGGLFYTTLNGRNLIHGVAARWTVLMQEELTHPQ